MVAPDKQEYIVQVIRQECKRAGIGLVRIILFGSRARHTESIDSDWDFLLSASEDLPFPTKSRVASAIRRRLASDYISADIVFKSESQIRSEVENVGVITHYALKEGRQV